MTLTLTADDGTQTPLKAKPSSMHAETLDDGQVKVTLAWATDDLAVNDPDGYKAVSAAWPGHGTLTIAGDDSSQQPPQDPGNPGEPQPTEGEALFEGDVSAVSVCDKSVRLSAVASADGGGEPGEDEPVIATTPNASDTSGLTVDIIVDNKGQGPGMLDLGDGSSPQPNAGDGTAVTTYAYAAAGTYTVTFTDDDDPSRTAQAQVTVPATA